MNYLTRRENNAKGMGLKRNAKGEIMTEQQIIDLDKLIDDVAFCKRTRVFQEYTQQEQRYCTLQTPDVKGFREKFECPFLGTKTFPVLIVDGVKVYLKEYWECYHR